MLKNITPRTYETIVEYDLVFDDGYRNGCGFPCNEKGELLEGLTEAAIKNYNYCLEHPEKFIRFNKVIRTERKVVNNAKGICYCGNEVELIDMYYGACQCEKCGQWYNLSGQMLLPPEEWEENLEEDY